LEEEKKCNIIDPEIFALGLYEILLKSNGSKKYMQLEALEPDLNNFGREKKRTKSGVESDVESFRAEMRDSVGRLDQIEHLFQEPSVCSGTPVGKFLTRQRIRFQHVFVSYFGNSRFQTPSLQSAISRQSVLEMSLQCRSLPCLEDAK